MKICTLRFEAPTSSELTLNDLRLALINALIARQRGEGFLLRMTDRNPEASSTDVKVLLDKCLRYDQHQSENLRRYRHLTATLLKAGNAYACTCDPTGPCDGTCLHRTPEELERLYRDKRPHAIRIVAPTSPITFDDMLLGDVTVSPDTIGAFLLIDPDGIPSASLASAVDDMLSGITTVLRDETQRDQTVREIHLRSLLGFTEAIRYGHIGPLGGDVPKVRALFEEGFLPGALISYLLAIGQTPPESPLTFSDAVAWFDLSVLAKARATYDRETLRACNRRHLKQMDDKALSGLYTFADADIGRLIKLYLDEAATLQELDRLILPIFAPKPCEGKDVETLRALSSLIISAPAFKHFEPFYAHIQSEIDLDDATLYPLLKHLLTGTTHGPALQEVYPHLKSYITEVARCQP